MCPVVPTGNFLKELTCKTGEACGGGGGGLFGTRRCSSRLAYLASVGAALFPLPLLVTAEFFPISPLSSSSVG